VALFVALLVMVLNRGFTNSISRFARDTIVAVHAGALQIHRQGFAKSIVEDNVLSKIGAIQIYHAGYLHAEQDLLRFDMADDPALVARMRAIPGVRAVTRRLAFEGMLGNGSISALFVATAIDPRAELEVCPRRHISTDPQQKLDSRDASGIFIGSVLAEGLSATPGTTLFASSSTQAGAPNALDVVLRGTLPESGGIFENKAGAIVPLATAQELLRMPGRVTEYVLNADNLEQAPRIAGELRKLLGSGYEVKIWRDWPHIRGLYQLMDIMGTVWASLLSILVISVIMNTMLMSIFERAKPGSCFAHRRLNPQLRARQDGGCAGHDGRCERRDSGCGRLFDPQNVSVGEQQDEAFRVGQAGTVGDLVR